MVRLLYLRKYILVQCTARANNYIGNTHVCVMHEKVKLKFSCTVYGIIIIMMFSV